MTTEEFNKIYKKYNQQLSFIASKYGRGLDHLDIEHAKNYAIFTAFGQKRFKAYLINAMKWECFAMARNNIDFLKKHKGNDLDIPFETNDNEIFTLLDDLTDKEKIVIKARMSNQNFTEIGEIIGLKREAARQFYLKTLKKLRTGH